jgi:hypothetical protein
MKPTISGSSAQAPSGAVEDIAASDSIRWYSPRHQPQDRVAVALAVWRRARNLLTTCSSSQIKRSPLSAGLRFGGDRAERARRGQAFGPLAN